MKFVYDDGGRAAAGYRGSTGDCVVRAISIASGRPYSEVYSKIADGNKRQRVTARTADKLSHRRTANGVYTNRKWFKDYMTSLGFVWTPCMTLGSGCTVHLRAGELPSGRLIALVSRHACAVIDGVVHDTYDPSRDGTRCVYGYWQLAQ